MYRSADIRRYQIFAYSDWPGGLFGSPSMSGTRPGGNIASSWAAMMSLGQNGYLDVAEKLMSVTQTLKDGIQAIPVFYDFLVVNVIVAGTYPMWKFSHDSFCFQINFWIEFICYSRSNGKERFYLITNLLYHIKLGWKIERGASCIHCTILPSHTIPVANQFITDLNESVNIVKVMITRYSICHYYMV